MDCLGLMLANQATGQTFTTLYNFTATNGPSLTNSDGAHPYAGLVLSSHALYGTAYGGGTNGVGTIFAVRTDGTGFTNLFNFKASSMGGGGGGGGLSAGFDPSGRLIISGSTLYGTARYFAGVMNPDTGAVFKFDTGGTGISGLASFQPLSNTDTNATGAHPYGGLVISGGNLYGTAYDGGRYDSGTVFTTTTNTGAVITNLYNFSDNSSSLNSDGANPEAELVLSGNTLYGTAYAGGPSGNGTVFAVNTDGTGFTNLYSFTARTSGTNGDGAHPCASLLLSGNTLYGTTQIGGSSLHGTVFALSTDGTVFKTLHNFSAHNTNTDGANPEAGLVLSGNTLYGTAYAGGSSGNGTVFALNTDGTGFTNLYSFTALSSGTNGDGANPSGGLLLSGNILYGTAQNGGNAGNGTVFSLALLPPQVAIIASGTNVIVTWPTPDAGVSLQSANNLAPPVVWNTNLPSPVIVNGQNAVTNPITGSQQFFRLSN